VLFFELFPVVFAVVSGIAALVLFAVNHRAKNDPDHTEAPRAPSRPDSSPDAVADPNARVRRPSMAP
jgi:hypothetical protein